MMPSVLNDWPMDETSVQSIHHCRLHGCCRVWIHVSDPSRWMDLDSELDLEARKRVISLYVPTGAIPVYPWKLAEGKFSLRKNTKCFALSFGALLSDEGELESYEVTPSLIMPQTSFNYSEAETAIEKGNNSDLNTLVDISKLRSHLLICPAIDSIGCLGLLGECPKGLWTLLCLNVMSK